MIHIQQLHYGVNITDKEGRILTVVQIHERGVRCTSPQMIEGHISLFPYEDIDGIPLTPEVLEKCGFDLIEWNKPKEGYGVRQYFKWLIPERCCISFYFGEFIGFENRLDKVTIGTPPHHSGSSFGNFKIQYLHELQNIFFTITGEELTYTT